MIADFEQLARKSFVSGNLDLRLVEERLAVVWKRLGVDFGFEGSLWDIDINLGGGKLKGKNGYLEAKYGRDLIDLSMADFVRAEQND